MASPHLRFPPAGNSTTASVSSSLTNVTVLAANINRLGATIHNNSNSRLYVKLGATATITDYSKRLESNEYYEVPFSYQGIIDGLWDPNVSGAARVTELTP